VVLAVALATVLLAGCGSQPGTVATEEVPKAADVPEVTVTEALDRPGEPLEVRGRLVAPERGVYRLCETLEAEPPDVPECADPFLIVQAVNLDAVDGLVTEEFGVRGGVTYSPETVQLLGSVTGAVLLIDAASDQSGVSGSPENPSGTTTTTAG